MAIEDVLKKSLEVRITRKRKGGNECFAEDLFVASPRDVVKFIFDDARDVHITFIGPSPFEKQTFTTPAQERIRRDASGGNYSYVVSWLDQPGNKGGHGGGGGIVIGSRGLTKK